jgi:hypothetical protein
VGGEDSGSNLVIEGGVPEPDPIATPDAGDSGSTTLEAGMPCTFPPDVDEPASAAFAGEWREPIEVPWSTGFEDGFCGFAIESGYCLASVDAAYFTTDSPVRSGRSAAAFSVATQDTVDGIQSRCVRRGVLPEEAYYGAWYFFPALVETPGNWNLFHFQGGEGAARHELWDVSIHNGDDGRLYLHVFNQLTDTIHNPPAAPALPIGEWVHVQLHLRRAADASGEVGLYQNGALLLRLTNIPTDDTTAGAWYVGNFADDLAPPELTVYVDDITITDTL